MADSIHVPAPLMSLATDSVGSLERGVLISVAGQVQGDWNRKVSFAARRLGLMAEREPARRDEVYDLLFLQFSQSADGNLIALAGALMLVDSTVLTADADARVSPLQQRARGEAQDLGGSSRWQLLSSLPYALDVQGVDRDSFLHGGPLHALAHRVAAESDCRGFCLEAIEQVVGHSPALALKMARALCNRAEEIIVDLHEAKQAADRLPESDEVSAHQIKDLESQLNRISNTFVSMCALGREARASMLNELIDFAQRSQDCGPFAVKALTHIADASARWHEQITYLLERKSNTPAGAEVFRLFAGDCIETLEQAFDKVFELHQKDVENRPSYRTVLTRMVDSDPAMLDVVVRDERLAIVTSPLFETTSSSNATVEERRDSMDLVCMVLDRSIDETLQKAVAQVLPCLSGLKTTEEWECIRASFRRLFELERTVEPAMSAIEHYVNSLECCPRNVEAIAKLMSKCASSIPPQSAFTLYLFFDSYSTFSNIDLQGTLALLGQRR